ncbi:class I SAM-dependent methyltransferase [Piscinibacter sakaiensis]|uniref:class I SAM-dependent methyltransferase n=1 Tax=Piscinibacter sakaiensis TaxID=1547922 RepID=UPI003AAEAE1B
MSTPGTHHSAAVFAEMFAASDDPWGFRCRWYEQRKRALTLASLPAPRYRRAFEPGCANGELAAALAERCDEVVASDGIDAAVSLARRRVSSLPNVEIVQGWVPDDWPAGRFDLIVLSEFGFYLSPSTLAAVIERTLASLDDGGTVLACHWRHPVAGFDASGDTVHAALAERIGLPRLVQHAEPDFLLDVWCRDPRSVAQREGFV